MVASIAVSIFKVDSLGSSSHAEHTSRSTSIRLKMKGHEDLMGHEDLIGHEDLNLFFKIS
jgi:hypothetical protein